MISYSELRKGAQIIFKNQPYVIVESAPMFKGRGHSVLQAKIRNLITGEIISWTFRPADSFEEPDISDVKLKFIYSNKNKYVFSKPDTPSQRFELEENSLGYKPGFLKPNQIVNGMFFRDKLVSLSLPIKINLEISQAPPVIKGQAAQAGTKLATLETGFKIKVPLFIKQGDLIEINTETGEYVKRVS